MPKHADHRTCQPTQDHKGVEAGFHKGITNMRKKGVEPDIATNPNIKGDVGPGFGAGFTKSG